MSESDRKGRRSGGYGRPMRRFVPCVLVLALLTTAARAAPPKPLRIVFPEGWSSRQMVDRVAAVRQIAIRKRHVTPRLTGVAYAAALRRAKPPPGFGSPRSIEGFLFPSTYFFDATTTGTSLVARQAAEFLRRWAAIRVPARRAPYGLLTVASMVEREAAVASERALISAVIWNRLDKGMRLGIDATIRYALGIPGTRPLTKAQLATPSPYNTRLRAGLPPTPISNPGLPSLRAAAAPASVNYLFYLRVPGTQRHFFTAEEAEFCAKASDWGCGGC